MKETLTIMARSVFVIAGIILFIIAININKQGNGAIIYELLGAILLITSAATLSQREASYLEIVIAAGSGAFSLLLANKFQGGTLLWICGVIVLMLSAIGFVKKLLRING